MHIWYIHPYGGGPGIGSYDRPYRLAAAWQRSGHTVTVFVAQHHHLLDDGVSIGRETDVEGIRYVGVPSRPYRGAGIGRLANVYDFCVNLLRIGADEVALSARPDAVIASSPHPFAAWPASRLARRFGAKFIFEIRDIWPLSLTEVLGMNKLHPFVFLASMAEKLALRRADLVASVLPRARRYLDDRGYEAKPFVWVPNGIGAPPPNAPATTSSALEKMTEWRSEGRPVVIYAGSLGRANAVGLLLGALAHGHSTRGPARYGVMIVGKGPESERLQAFVEQNELSAAVHFAGAVPKADAIRLMANADIGYAGLKDIDRVFRYGISPNKIADYFAASLPVLLPIGPCGDPVSESGGGIARRMQTPELLWDALDEMLTMSPEQRRAMGLAGRDYVAREYDYDVIAARYLSAIEAAA